MPASYAAAISGVFGELGKIILSQRIDPKIHPRSNVARVGGAGARLQLDLIDAEDGVVTINHRAPRRAAAK